MRLKVVLAAGFAVLLAAAPAGAQPAGDPIGALLETPSASARPAAVEVIPGPPAYAPPPRPPLTAPVQVDETGKSPDAEPTVTDLAYESRLRASSASAQRFQGPLDGGWTLAAAGSDLYALQLVDRGNGVVEGAWRDLRRRGALSGSGFVDQIETQAGDLTLRFTLASGALVEAVLHAAHDGAWTGEFVEAGERRPARLSRK